MSWEEALRDLAMVVYGIVSLLYLMVSAGISNGCDVTLRTGSAVRREYILGARLKQFVDEREGARGFSCPNLLRPQREVTQEDSRSVTGLGKLQTVR